MAWPQDAYVGQEVVCIGHHDVFNPLHQANLLNIGEVYRISEINQGKSYLYFAVNGGWLYWLASQFRPVEERKTDISIFTSMLGPKQKETADG